MPLIEDERQDDPESPSETTDDDKEPAEVLELKSLMESATTPRNSNKDPEKPYKDFKARLKSFTPARYFAMPIQVSPLVCAVSGWKMKEDSSILICQSCDKLVSIKVPHYLSANDKMKLCKTYRSHLWDTHADHCPFRVEARRFLQCQPAKLGKGLILPVSLSRLLPQSDPALAVLESSLRCNFRDRVVVLSSVIKDYTVAAQIPADVADYRANDAPSATDEDMEASLVNRIVSCCHVERTATNETAAALALLGWGIQDYNHGTKCTICLAQRPFEDNSANPRGSKWNHVVDAHRFWCPWVCGLPHDPSPLWKILADRILADDSGIDDDNAGFPEDGLNTVDQSAQCFELRKLLDSGISRKRLKRSRSWNKA